MLEVMAAALTALQVFDGWTTWRILRAGGRELNGNYIFNSLC